MRFSVCHNDAKRSASPDYFFGIVPKLRNQGSSVMLPPQSSFGVDSIFTMTIESTPKLDSFESTLFPLPGIYELTPGIRNRPVNHDNDPMYLILWVVPLTFNSRFVLNRFLEQTHSVLQSISEY